MKIRIAGLSAAVAAGLVAFVWLTDQGIGQPASSPGANVDGASVCDLATTVEGVYAIGDARAGSTKRVAAAVGEGAAVVAQIHQLLAASSEVPASEAAVALGA